MQNKKYNILFITSQWSGGEPKFGSSQSEHLVINTLRNTNYCNLCVWYNDAFFHLTQSNNCLSSIRTLCDGNNFDFIMLNLFGSPDVIYDPPIEIIKNIKEEYNLPIVSFWWDASYNVINLNRYQHLTDVCIRMDGNASLENIQYPEKCVCAPELLDTSLFTDRGLNRDIDFSFVGSNYGGLRLHYINAFQSSTLIPFFIIGGQNESKIPHKDYANILQRSKITWNISWAECGTPQLKGRMFEAIASGALLMDWNGAKHLIEPYLIEGEHYVGYDSPEDAINKVRYYLDNEQERIQIAQNGYKQACQMCNPKEWWKNNVFNKLGLYVNDN